MSAGELAGESWLGSGAVSVVVVGLASLLVVEILRHACELLFLSRGAAVPVRQSAVLITGAGSGFGRALALESARRGASHVLLWDRNGATAEETARLVAELGTDCVALPRCVDVTDADAVERGFAEDVDRVVAGRRLVVVNNAGIVAGSRFTELSDAAVRRVFDVNVLSHFRINRLALARMTADGAPGGKFVTVSSVMGLLGSGRLAEYCASKSAAIAMTESLRLELAADGLDDRISCLTVCPYAATTGMFEGIFDNGRSIVFPWLTPERVALAILRAVERGDPMIVLPWYTWYIVVIARLLPVAVCDFAVGVCGGWTGMETFRGGGLHRHAPTPSSS